MFSLRGGSWRYYLIERYSVQKQLMIYLVDASIYVFRAWFSLPDDMVDKHGNPVNAVYGFTRFLCDLIEKEKPDGLAMAFDESLTTSYRNEIYPDYKANRPPAPEDIKYQFECCRKICDALGVRQFGSSRYEADDIVGTLAAKARADGKQVAVVSGDKDLAQLLAPGDILLDPGKKRLAYEDIAEHFGVMPERIADFLALTGDAVDNIPGVPGIGKKTATTLLSTYPTLDALYDDLNGIFDLKMRGASRVVRLLEEHREQAYLARRLTIIHTEVPLDAGPKDLGLRAPDAKAVNALFDEYDFGLGVRKQVTGLSERHIAAHTPQPLELF